MNTTDFAGSLATLFAELVEGADKHGGAYVLNSGDIGMLASLDTLGAAEASQSTNGGATIAAHAQHLRYGLSLMNRWAREGGNPFADAKWDEAWKTSRVDEREWSDIRNGLRNEAHQWLAALKTPREDTVIEVNGLIGSIAHFAYHLGAMRQISRTIRGPKEGTFT